MAFNRAVKIENVPYMDSLNVKNTIYSLLHVQLIKNQKNRHDLAMKEVIISSIN
jgi:hypothetical protein